MNIRRSAGTFVFVAGLAMTAAAWADPVPFGFVRITQNGVDVTSQLHLMLDVGTNNQVVFTLSNSGPTASSITQVLFDDNPANRMVSTPLLFVNGPGVVFRADNAPLSLPGGNTVSPAFVPTFGGGSVTQRDGVNPGESLGIVLVLMGGHTFSEVVAAMNTATLRMGLYVQGLPNDQSDSYISGSAQMVPLPEGVYLGAAGLAGVVGLGWVRRRRLA